MALLAAFLGNAFAGLITLLASWLGKKVAVSAALIAVYTAGLGTLWAAIKLLVGGLTVLLPSDGLGYWMLMGMNMVLPDNWEVCAAAMLSADAAVFLYRFNQTRIVGAAAQS